MARKKTPIDDYLATLAPSPRKALAALREAILAVVPGAEECVSYRMPAFRVGGRVVAGFAARGAFCSYYPFSGRTLRTLARALAGYEQAKSALHFDPKRGLPPSLVRELVEARLAE